MKFDQSTSKTPERTNLYQNSKQLFKSSRNNNEKTKIKSDL